MRKLHHRYINAPKEKNNTLIIITPIKNTVIHVLGKLLWSPASIKRDDLGPNPDNHRITTATAATQQQIIIYRVVTWLAEKVSVYVDSRITNFNVSTPIHTAPTNNPITDTSSHRANLEKTSFRITSLFVFVSISILRFIVEQRIGYDQTIFSIGRITHNKPHSERWQEPSSILTLGKAVSI